VICTSGIDAQLTRPELRNKIYALCTERDPLTDRPKPQTCQFGDQLAGNENQVHFYPFDFLALTQTCGLLRAEFRPLWIQANSGAVNLERLSQYLRVFFPSSHSYDTTDRVTIVVFDDMEHDVDVTGFLDLNIIAPFVFNFQALKSEEFSTRQFSIERNVRVLNYTLFPFYRRSSLASHCSERHEKRGIWGTNIRRIFANGLQEGGESCVDGRRDAACKELSCLGWRLR
jgi:hypothetical protein